MHANVSLVPSTMPPKPNGLTRPAKTKHVPEERHGRNRALCISPAKDDQAALRRILDGIAWRLCAVSSCHEAVEQLRRGSVSIVLCDSELEDGSWKDVLNHIRGVAHPPLLVVTSRLADDYLWAEVLNLGGYDVLAKPFNQREVSHVLTTALLSQADVSAHTQTANAG
jgi:DNA-binding response OmpR family regulator